MHQGYLYLVGIEVIDLQNNVINGDLTRWSLNRSVWYSVKIHSIDVCQ